MVVRVDLDSQILLQFQDKKDNFHIQIRAYNREDFIEKESREISSQECQAVIWAKGHHTNMDRDFLGIYHMIRITKDTEELLTRSKEGFNAGVEKHMGLKEV